MIEVLFKIFLGLLLLQGLILVMPPRIIREKPEGKNAYNTPFKIVIDPHHKYFEAVLGHEVYEHCQKQWIHYVLFLYLSKKERQWLEIRGQEIETQIAVLKYNVIEEVYRERQAKDLAEAYKDFEGVDYKLIKADMQRFTLEAKRWVKENVN